MEILDKIEIHNKRVELILSYVMKHVYTCYHAILVQLTLSVRMKIGIINLERIVTDKAHHFILGVTELN